MPLSDRDLQRMQDAAERRKKAEPGASVDAKTIDHPARIVMGTCPKCEKTVGLHCSECKLQITGCGCTLGAAIADELEKSRLLRMGLWTPDQEN